jgi:hypothetical protein
MGLDPPSASPNHVSARSRDWPTWIAVAVVLGGQLALMLGSVLKVIPMPNDAVGYIATARNWIEGQGFVDPIVYSYYLEGATAPIPAIAVRPPGISLLLAIPLALGSGLLGLAIVHAIWSAAIGASILL